VNKNNNKLYLPIGVSGCGKTTFCKEYSEKMGLVYLSSDGLRGIIGKDESDQTVSGKVFDTLRTMVSYLLSNDYSVLLDATNYNKKNRRDFLNIAKTLGKPTIGLRFNVPIELAKQRNASRDRKVPEYVIDNQFSRLEEPTQEEGFAVIFQIDENGKFKPEI
jgi:protein phosphatase